MGEQEGKQTNRALTQSKIDILSDEKVQDAVAECFKGFREPGVRSLPEFMRFLWERGVIKPLITAEEPNIMCQIIAQKVAGFSCVLYENLKRVAPIKTLDVCMQIFFDAKFEYVGFLGHNLKKDIVVVYGIQWTPRIKIETRSAKVIRESSGKVTELSPLAMNQEDVEKQLKKIGIDFNTLQTDIRKIKPSKEKPPKI